MDPLSQGILGSIFAGSSVRKKPLLPVALLVGMVSGWVPDLDILIRSEEDSLLSLEYHRHFTHALFFVPFGALFMAGAFKYSGLYSAIPFKSLYLFAFLGMLSHGLLDACTSYGTSLYWPISQERIAWNIIAIIDLFFTLPLTFLVFLSLYQKRISTVRYAMLFAILYLSLGYFQNQTVQSIQANIAKSRGHVISKSKLNPTIGNLLLWRSVYQSDQLFYVDAIYKPLVGKASIYQGESYQKVAIDASLDSRTYKDIKRFERFSQGFIYHYPYKRNIIADLRYGTLPYDGKSLWGIEIDPNNQESPAVYKNLRHFTKADWEIFKSLFSSGAIFTE